MGLQAVDVALKIDSDLWHGLAQVAIASFKTGFAAGAGGGANTNMAVYAAAR
jgi:hypothetical protein